MFCKDNKITRVITQEEADEIERRNNTAEDYSNKETYSQYEWSTGNVL